MTIPLGSILDRPSALPTATPPVGDASPSQAFLDALAGVSAVPSAPSVAPSTTPLPAQPMPSAPSTSSPVRPSCPGTDTVDPDSHEASPADSSGPSADLVAAAALVAVPLPPAPAPAPASAPTPAPTRAAAAGAPRSIEPAAAAPMAATPPLPTGPASPALPSHERPLRDPAPVEPSRPQTPTAPSTPVVVPAPTPMTAPAPPANAPPTAQPMPTARPEEQPALTAALSRIGTGANRVHELTVELHPAELGAVHVRATLHGGTLDVTVSCADDTARQAVTAALPSLHSQLGSLGSVDVALAGPGTPARPSEPGAGQPHSQNPQQHPPDASPDDRRPPRRQRDDESFEQWM